MSGYNIVWALLGVAVVCSLAYVFTPKSNEQTVIRTVIIMSLICCYIMWAITYLAQLHPLIFPRKVGLRPPHESPHA
ncbi:ATP synthase subunit H-domain-containing protein [Pilobolus umbonatus]|nr:ATP synthase subunit H-domain-containing protein [Pilobolus umbonatus]